VSGTVIRNYAEDDYPAVRECFVELQEHERALHPGKMAGNEVADRYLALMFERCRIWAGQVFVADEDGRVIGFVCVWTRVVPEEPDEVPAPFAFISDLIVRSERRGSGIGHALMQHAEQHARAAGATSLRVCVLARNEGAYRLYRELGFSELEVELEKSLGANPVT